MKSISESFKRRADSACFYEAWVGAVLSRKGLHTHHHPFTMVNETGYPLGYYAQTWDLEVSASGIVYVPCEVKSTNLEFHGTHDYPHMGVLVCSEKNWDNKWPNTCMTQRDFLIVSRLTGDIVWLPRGSEVGRTEITDKTRGEKYWCKTTHKGELRNLEDFVASFRTVEVTDDGP